MRTVRQLSAFVLIGIAIVICFAIVQDAYFPKVVTDAEIQVSAVGDILGLGFVFTWIVSSLILCALLGLATLICNSKYTLRSSLVVVGFYLGVSVFWYKEFSLLEARVFGL